MMELSLIAKATLILAVALGAARASRRARASVRSLILASAFGLLLMLPAASAILPARELPIPHSYVSSFLIEAPAAPMNSSATIEPDPARESTRRLPALSLRWLLGIVWLLGAAVTSTPLLLGLWQLRRVRRRGSRWTDRFELAATLPTSAGVRRPVRIVLHDDVVTPMTFGWMRPTIAMPADAPRWSSVEIQQALLHEIEHVRRHDWPVHVAARMTCALYWFHPFAWIAWRQLLLESEHACDDAVLVQTERTAYAQQLVSLARRLHQAGPAPLLSMAARSSLAARVQAVLDSTQSRGRVGVTAALAILGTAGILIAGLTPLQAEVDQRSARSAEDPWTFEVASVKPNSPDDRVAVNQWDLRSGRLNLRNQTLRSLVRKAYGTNLFPALPAERISGGPAWLDTERFTIEARAPQGSMNVDAEQRMIRMLRHLLEDRFQLTVRVEPRPMSVQVLVMTQRGRPGPRLRTSTIDCAVDRCGAGGGGGRYEFNGMQVSALARMVGEIIGATVVDETGLNGVFEGTLEWAPSPEQIADRGQPATPEELARPSIVTALQEQWGIRLVGARRPIDYFVIASANRPASNDAALRGSREPWQDRMSRSPRSAAASGS